MQALFAGFQCGLDDLYPLTQEKNHSSRQGFLFGAHMHLILPLVSLSIEDFYLLKPVTFLDILYIFVSVRGSCRFILNIERSSGIHLKIFSTLCNDQNEVGKIAWK